MRGPAYTLNEKKAIVHFYYNKGMTAKEIAKITGRTADGISNLVRRHKDLIPPKDYVPTVFTTKENEDKIKELLEKSEEPKVSKQHNIPEEVKVTPQLSPREMIKHLYSIGYRIKDNGLVVLVEQPVNIKDIIING